VLTILSNNLLAKSLPPFVRKNVSLSWNDMLHVWINVVYLDDTEFQRLVDARKAKLTATNSVRQP
jgi:hypothetical protein